jgi:(p)ppGpp synthase/HD superfamily hydrolase
MNLEQKAKEFALKSHFGQKRKYSGVDYITHPEAVANIVRSVDHTEDMLAAAWLHDVVEDCGISISALRELFPDRVVSLVDWLTDVSKPTDGNRSRRKHLDLLHISKASLEAKTIKIADILDNTSTIDHYDPVFSKVYLPEKVELLTVLKEGNPVLWRAAWIQVRDAQKEIGEKS